ncbi:hypothetical protein JTE90_003270 [Oedothorax gibbosus]|uniref:Nucleolar pre-ribosomal-associated protein 1 n=1 Tax=Oedothorax gibbosus TaxID=931172 RepID=A0AAV6V5B7_9ARAC|nr:hypothetical protein JTE90_003270 [Oedothorax gibbosus]
MAELKPADVIFQGISQNNEPFKHLTDLVNQADEFNAKNSDYDVIKAYIKASGNCQEILQFVKDVAVVDLPKAYLLFKALYHILIRIASDLNVYIAAGTSIVNEVLSYGMRTVFNFLKSNQKSSRNKIALNLLAAMVALGNQASQQVVAKLDFTHVNFFHLLNRSNNAYEEDVRTAFLNLIVLILTVCNNNVIRQMVEAKGFLNHIFPGINYDRTTTVSLILDTFRAKIIENRNISKTNKVRLFNEHTLSHVIKLYTWKGPLRIKKFGKRKLGDEPEPLAFEATEEDALVIRKSAHQFMLALCTTKIGIIFNDPSLGFSGKNLNQTITHVLQSFKNPYFNDLIIEFLVTTLKACPDQLRFYLPTFKDTFKPRLSVSFVNAIKFFKEVIKSQDPVSLLFKSSVERSVPALLNIAKTFCMLNILDTSEIVETLNNGHHVLCYYLCCVMSDILEQANNILEFNVNAKPSEILCDTSELLVFQQSFIKFVLKQFPVMKELQTYWSKITSGTSEDTDEVCDLNNVPIPSLLEEILTILTTIKSFQSLYLKSGMDFDVDLVHMLSSIEKDKNLLPFEDLQNVYLNIAELLSRQNPLTMWNKDKGSTPLTVVVEFYQAAHKAGDLVKAKDLVYKVLLYTNVFDQCKWEIDAWLESLERTKSKHIRSIFGFINEALLDIFQHPKQFAIRETNKQCFSKFVPATLNCLQNSDIKGCQLFVERALTLIMHHQHSPQAFFQVVKPYKNIISSSLFSYWEILSSPKKISMDKIQSLADNAPCPLDLGGHLKRNFMANHSPETSVEICSCNLKNLLEELDANSVRKVIWQILMYMDFETTLILENGKQDAVVGVNTYLMLLQQLLHFLSSDSFNTPQSIGNPSETNSEDITDDDTVNKSSTSLLLFETIKETLCHPIMLKLFIDARLNKFMSKDNIATKLVLSMTQSLLDTDDSKYHECLMPFKNKVISSLQDGNYLEDDEEFDSILGVFSVLFTTNDIVNMLESLLNNNKNVENLSSVFLLLKIFLERDSCSLLSPTCFSSLISKYVTVPKKSKKILRSYITQLLDNHPKYALLVDEDAAQLLVQGKTKKDLTLLGKLIDGSGIFRQVVHNFVAGIEVEDEDSTGFIYLASKCILQCQTEVDSDTNFKQVITSKYWRVFSEYLLNDEHSDYDLLKECGAGMSAGQLLHQKNSVPKKLNSFCKSLLEREVPNPSKMCVLLQFLHSWKLYEADVNKTVNFVLKITCSWLLSSISEEFSCFELTKLIKDVLQGSSDLEITEIIDIRSFFSKCLKTSLKYDNIGKEVLSILTLLCEKSKEGILPIVSIYGLVTGHSSFFQVMLSEEIEKNNFKESVVDLLIILTKLDPSVCKENHIGLFLSAYGATMTTVDQKLLYLMKLYAENEINMSTYSPFLWGKPAIGHYSVMSSSQQYLWKQPKLQDVLSLFLPEMIDLTILNFPLNITLQPTYECVEIEERLRNKIYDLRFVLHLFANLLAPGYYVNCRRFVDSRVLMIIFASLSCTESDVRALGYFCLSQFYNQLESENFREKGIWLCLLDSLRNSISSGNAKIPCIVTLFLARTADIFTKPDHQLYPVISKFITVKPYLDIGQVPEYFKLFNSTELDHRIHRRWLLCLLSDGLRTSADFHICEKRNIINVLLHYYFSSLASNQEKIAIIRVLCCAAKIQSSSRTLCERGLLVWIQAIMQGEPEVRKNLCVLMGNIENTIPEKYTFLYKSIHLSLLESMKTGNG